MAGKPRSRFWQPRCPGRAQCLVRGHVLLCPHMVGGARELREASDPPDLTPHGPAPCTLKRAGAGLRSAGTQRERQSCHGAVPCLAVHLPSRQPAGELAPGSRLGSCVSTTERIAQDVNCAVPASESSNKLRLATEDFLRLA